MNQEMGKTGNSLLNTTQEKRTDSDSKLEKWIKSGEAMATFYENEVNPEPVAPSEKTPEVPPSNTEKPRRPPTAISCWASRCAGWV